MKRARIVVPIVLIAGGLGWVGFQGLAGSLVYYKTPTELLRDGRTGERVRVGGLVVPGSVSRETDAIRFVVTDGTSRITVVGTGGVPRSFRAGQGVVVEGALLEDGAFHAETVLVKHNEEYRTPGPGETPHTADVG